MGTERQLAVLNVTSSPTRDYSYDDGLRARLDGSEVIYLKAQTVTTALLKTSPENPWERPGDPSNLIESVIDAIGLTLCVMSLVPPREVMLLTRDREEFEEAGSMMLAGFRAVARRETETWPRDSDRGTKRRSWDAEGRPIRPPHFAPCRRRAEPQDRGGRGRHSDLCYSLGGWR